MSASHLSPTLLVLRALGKSLRGRLVILVAVVSLLIAVAALLFESKSTTVIIAIITILLDVLMIFLTLLLLWIQIHRLDTSKKVEQASSSQTSTAPEFRLMPHLPLNFQLDSPSPEVPVQPPGFVHSNLSEVPTQGFLPASFPQPLPESVLTPGQAPSPSISGHEMMSGVSMPAAQAVSVIAYQTDKARLMPYIAGTQHFILPKEGEAPENCQDKYDFDDINGRYAVADGVSQSFVPGQWAQIVATEFIKYRGEFHNEQEFVDWLLKCSNDWRTWIEDKWIPRANSRRQQGNGQRNQQDELWLEKLWRENIDQQILSGAQTTFIGCSLEVLQDGRLGAHVFSVGDANFFLFRQISDRNWTWEAFPYTDPNQFTSKPRTLATPPDQMRRGWAWKETATFEVLPGDYIVLASDALAKWLLTQVQQKKTKHWVPLLLNTNQDVFKAIIDEERKQHRMEDDDVTMLVVPIRATGNLMR